ncbi:hypothetical protein ACFDTO_00705 [Microbacteriaceae bacterium 4G12]
MDVTTDGEYAIFLNGSYGVGKTATLDPIGNLLAEAGRPFSLMDVDWFHRSWPTADFDEHNTVIEARNMAAVWANYRSAGPRQLVVSGVLTGSVDVDRYADALGIAVRPVRLVADDATIRARLRARYGATGAAELDWHLERYAGIRDRQARGDLDEAVLPTDALQPVEVARAVLAHFASAH